MNSSSAGYGRSQGTRTQVERSVAPGQSVVSDARYTTSTPAYNSRVANQHQSTAAAQSQRSAADHSRAQVIPVSSYQQNPPQSSMSNRVTPNTGVQRTPYIPSVSITCLCRHSYASFSLYWPEA